MSVLMSYYTVQNEAPLRLPLVQDDKFSRIDQSNNINTNPAPTIQELKQIIPVVFEHKKPLNDYFTEELFFAENLVNLSNNFPSLTTNNNGSSSLSDLNNLESSVNKLLITVQKADDELLQKFEFIKHNLNLQIFSNVKCYNQISNSREMLNGLVNFKLAFQEFSSHLNDLDDLIMFINDQIDDLQGCNNFTTIRINQKLSSCSSYLFQSLINQVILIFNEYVHCYQNQTFNDDNDFYTYDIILFDDHVKSVVDMY